MLRAAVDRSSTDDSVIMICTSGFVNDGSRHIFTSWGQWAKIKHDVVSSTSPDGSIGGEVWRLRLRCLDNQCTLAE